MSAPTFTANGQATLIGSIPLESHTEALDLIFKYTPQIPLWPQLPSIKQEGMLVQFLEGFPGLDKMGDKTIFNPGKPDFDTEVLSFFEDYLALEEDPTTLLTSRFKVSKENGKGLYDLKDLAKPADMTAVKGQITGPFTLLTGVTDQENRACYYDPTLREIIHKGLAMKAAWQVRFLKQIHDNVILFMDEPALAGLGSSAFISISKEDIKQDQTEIITAIQQAGGIAGVHICANSDWPLILSLGYDIINFDAYGFFDKFVTCKNDIHGFLNRGGIIAWGIVPTGNEEDIMRESAESLADMWQQQAGLLCSDQWDYKKILGQTLITPSCGTGSLSEQAAGKVLSMTHDLSQILQNEYL
jgi:methionine synthase II (cobalamin-independent)